MSPTRKRAVVICISTPHPRSTGSRLRSLSVIQSLVALGYQFTAINPRDTREPDDQIVSQLGLEKGLSLPVTSRKLLMVQDYLRCLLDIKQIEISYTQLRLSFRARILLGTFLADHVTMRAFHRLGRKA